MSALIGSLILLLLIAVFVALTLFAWRWRIAYLKWPATAVSRLIAGFLVLFAGLAVRGYSSLYSSQSGSFQPVRVSSSPDQLARGEHLAHLCVGCHSPAGTLPLAGGNNSFLPPPLGQVYPSNLTPAGPIVTWPDGAVVRAIREGLDNNGRPLLIMPSENFHSMSDADVQAIVAYLRSQPAVAHTSPSASMSPLGAALVGAGSVKTSAQTPLTEPVKSPAPGPSAAYGSYLLEISGCRTCHGDNLTGGTSQYAPKGPNIRVLTAQWTPAQFVQMIGTGKDPSGHVLSDAMPFRDFSAAYSDDELTAISAYLRALPPP